jgi:hypothetical protein
VSFFNDMVTLTAGFSPAKVGHMALKKHGEITDSQKVWGRRNWKRRPRWTEVRNRRNPARSQLPCRTMSP